MKETQAFENFVPKNARYLILGSFPVKQAVKETAAYDSSYDWFYSVKRNQFWPILEEVYGLKLTDKPSKQKLFSDLGMAIADIILSCERKKNSNLDVNLMNMVYNTSIAEILDNYHIEKIFFTSRFVERKFRTAFKIVIKEHPSIELITLPSPSPRYVLISKEQKIMRYKELLPKIG